jgi:hypothetical protein
MDTKDKFKAITSLEGLNNFSKETALTCPVCEKNRSDKGAFVGIICAPCFERTVRYLEGEQKGECDTCRWNCDIKNIAGKCLKWRPKK